MQPKYKINSAQNWVQEKKYAQKKIRGRSPRIFRSKKISDVNHSKVYLGSNANLMVCAKSAKCILVILSEVEANAAFTVPFKATI
ncbi:MAG: hypothetical protein RIR44_816 [Bacteroidota bacterium]